jgi:hypothetical protein
MPTITFKARLFKPDATEKIGSGVLLTLPKDASEKLPSKGMVFVNGTINGFPFQSALEPDGKESHWFKVGVALRKGAKADVDDTVSLSIEPTKDWPKPKVPADLRKALDKDAKARTTWEDITPMARWDWIRWIGSGRLAETRTKHVLVACSKLRSGMRRPCCFNRTQCTLTDA